MSNPMYTCIDECDFPSIFPIDFASPSFVSPVPPGTLCGLRNLSSAPLFFAKRGWPAIQTDSQIRPPTPQSSAPYPYSQDPQGKSGMSQHQSASKTEMADDLTVEQIAKLRLVVAWFGEMDRAKWWNTKGMLANIGEMAIRRGFARTHLFARAQAVFAVASHRCDEIFNPPEAYTLWKLPPAIADKLQDAWSVPPNILQRTLRIRPRVTPSLTIC